MTCIVGWEENNNVWIGGDSVGIDEESLGLVQRADPKVFKKDDFIFGFAGSFRMGQLIKYKLQIPDITINQDIDTYLHTTFIDSLITCFEESKFLKTTKDDQAEMDQVLFGFQGHLYLLDQDFQIEKSIHCFNAIGCGCDMALGSLYSMRSLNTPPELKILNALQASEAFSGGVRGPFTILSLKD